MTDPKGSSGPRPGTSAPLGQEPDPSGSFPGAKGKALSLEGRITGDMPKVAEAPPPPVALAPLQEVAPDASGLPRLEALTTSDLELVRDERPRAPAYEEPDNYRPEPPKSRRRSLLVLGALLALGALALGVFALQPDLARALPTLPTQKGSVVIHSEPDGAEVFVEGQHLGQTPVAADNLWGGSPRYEVKLEGYLPATGTFKGGEKARVEVTLKKAP